jgi:hypothetical protein
MSEITELYTDSIASFKLHIEDKENHRTIFTGRFGAGKTMFLKYFFNHQKTTIESEKYYPIHIFPVNYSISGNDDVIKFIKYDIITHLLLNKSVDIIESIDLKTVSGRFLINNIDRILASIFLFIPTWGSDAYKAYEVFEGLVKDFSNLKKTESDQITEFIDKVQGDVKSTFEEDFITSLIQKACNDLNERGKEVVVIIDDLDRIDPDHIFRILNVFAAHLDFHGILEQPNKYGFEKVILVGDIHNIRNIFKAKFGIETDFNGYIDKFYSKNIYQFDNRNAINSLTNKIVNEITFLSSNPTINDWYETLIKKRLDLPVIQFLIINNIITTRQLFKYFNRKFYLSNDKSIYLNGERYPEHFCSAAIFLGFVNKLFNSPSDFIEKIKNANIKIKRQDTDITQFYEELTLIYYLTDENYIDKPKTGQVSFENYLTKIRFKMEVGTSYGIFNVTQFQTIWEESQGNLPFTEIPFKEVFLGAVEGLNKFGFFED